MGCWAAMARLSTSALVADMRWLAERIPRAQFLSLSPCLLISLFPCFSVSFFSSFLLSYIHSIISLTVHSSFLLGIYPG